MVQPRLPMLFNLRSDPFERARQLRSRRLRPMVCENAFVLGPRRRRKPTLIHCPPEIMARSKPWITDYLRSFLMRQPALSSRPHYRPTAFSPIKPLRLAIFAVLLPLMFGCGGLERLPPAPVALSEQITVLGIPNAHFWPDTQGAEILREWGESLNREKTTGHVFAGPDGRLPPAAFLAISGGGDDGAFGAGLLSGWSARGTRPNFKLVTGVSTGAMMAPFAFLGHAYDDKLRAMFTQISPERHL